MRQIPPLLFVGTLIAMINMLPVRAADASVIIMPPAKTFILPPSIVRGKIKVETLSGTAGTFLQFSVSAALQYDVSEYRSGAQATANSAILRANYLHGGTLPGTAMQVAHPLPNEWIVSQHPAQDGKGRSTTVGGLPFQNLFLVVYVQTQDPVSMTARRQAAQKVALVLYALKCRATDYQQRAVGSFGSC